MQTGFHRKVNSLVFLLSLIGSALIPVGALGLTDLYDASLGTFPEAQGWTLNEDIMPPASYPVSVSAAGLYLSTLGFGVNVPPDVGGGVSWSRPGLGIDFTQDFAVEARVKIVDAPDHSINTTTGWPRPGYTISLTDVSGRSFWIGLGSTEVFLSNTFYGQYGQPNTVDTPFVTTDQYHVYRIERASGGVGAALRIDGALVLELPTLGPVETTELLYFGDPTYWANSESYTSWVRYETPATTVGTPTFHSAPLRVSPLRNPAETISIGFSSSLSGTLTLELFDVAGRRLEYSRRSVSVGQYGSFEPSRSLPSGMYFYRATLVAIERNIVLSGRVAVVR